MRTGPGTPRARRRVYTRAMAEDPARRERMRALLIGGVVGASAALAAARRRRPATALQRPRPVGLAAFEDAPCFREALVDEPLPEPQRPAQPV